MNVSIIPLLAIAAAVLKVKAGSLWNIELPPDIVAIVPLVPEWGQQYSEFNSNCSVVETSNSFNT